MYAYLPDSLKRRGWICEDLCFLSNYGKLVDDFNLYYQLNTVDWNVYSELLHLIVQSVHKPTMTRLKISFCELIWVVDMNLY